MPVLAYSRIFQLLTTFQAGTKFVCAVLSLPVPSKSSNLCGEASISRPVPDYIENRILQKILLVGCDGSGTSTIFKQVVIVRNLISILFMLDALII